MLEITPSIDSYFSLELTTSETGYIISALNKDNMPASIVLPSYYNGKPVTNIKYNGFTVWKTIIKAIIPKSVESIGNLFFSTNWIININSICTNNSTLEKVIFEENSNLKTLRAGVFNGCARLLELPLHESL